jgi:hypothetical protein
MEESDVYETKKSFVNVTCYFRFIKCTVSTRYNSLYVPRSTSK